MSATETTTPEDHGAHGAHHPTPRDYVNIAIILAAITAAEVVAYFFALPEWALWSGYTLMAAAKFAIVVGFYMHLKYDSRMFRRLFIFGISLALFVFLIVVGIFALPRPYLPEDRPLDEGQAEALGLEDAETP